MAEGYGASEFSKTLPDFFFVELADLVDHQNRRGFVKNQDKRGIRIPSGNFTEYFSRIFLHNPVKTEK